MYSLISLRENDIKLIKLIFFDLIFLFIVKEKNLLVLFIIQLLQVGGQRSL